MNNNVRVNIDYILLFSTIALMFIGILFIYSSGVNADGVQTSNEYLRQVIWAVIGIVLLLSISMVKYDIYREFSTPIYIGGLLLILFTVIFGSVINGARSWIGIGSLGIQPSEFMKVAVILILASYMDSRGSAEISSFKGFVVPLLFIALPMGLVLLQPDLGTAMVFIPIALFIMYSAGVRVLYLMFLLMVMMFTILFTMLPEWERMIYPGDINFFAVFNDRLFILLVIGALVLSLIVAVTGYLVLKKAYMYYIAYIFSTIIIGFVLALGVRWFLRDFQMMRLIVFIDPSVDPRGSGWNIIQSITAVGSGGFSGMGYLQGTQSHYQYLPEQSTDFIFSILSEEWGFLGGLLISSLYGTIIVRGLIIAHQARDKFGSYLAIGVVALFFFHFAINVGMTIGMMPITGIPLLFLSYGGSSLWTALIAMGMLMSVSNYRFKY